MLSQAMAQRIEHWSLDKLIPYPKNPRRHSDAQIAQIAGSIAQFGFNSPILIDSMGNIIAGNGRYLAALKLGLEMVPVVVLDHLSEIQKRAYILADNKLAELGGYDDELLAIQLAELRDADIDLQLLGFNNDELRVLLADAEASNADEAEEEEIPEPPAEPVTRAGDTWLVGKHRLICGDCRDRDVVHRLFAGTRANLVIPSPPYAAQREYDAGSGFTPVAPEKYSDWYSAVAANIATVLAPDGSYFLNIKEHADGGQRSLYVKDLLIAHVRQWGWWFIDELCWRKTDNGVPGGWGNRFKNAWEPVFHFSAPEARIKFRPTAVGHLSEDCFDYSPNNPKSTSGSGLLGTGGRGLHRYAFRDGAACGIGSDCGHSSREAGRHNHCDSGGRFERCRAVHRNGRRDVSGQRGSGGARRVLNLGWRGEQRGHDTTLMVITPDAPTGEAVKEKLLSRLNHRDGNRGTRHATSSA